MNRQHKGQKKKDKQRSTKHTHTTKDRVTRTPLNTGDELGCSRREGSSYSTSGTRRVNLVTISFLSNLTIMSLMKVILETRPVQ